TQSATHQVTTPPPTYAPSLHDALPISRPTTLDPTKPQLMGLLPSKPTRCCGQPRPLWASPQLCAQTCSAHGRKTTEPVADHKGRGLSAHIDGGPILSARIATVTPEESSPQRPAPTHPFTTQA